MSGGWTVPMCWDCWRRKYGERVPVQLREQYRELVNCNECGRETLSGIYVRRDPHHIVRPPWRYR